jgi:hypothetical protein
LSPQLSSNSLISTDLSASTNYRDKSVIEESTSLSLLLFIANCLVSIISLPVSNAYEREGGECNNVTSGFPSLLSERDALVGASSREATLQSIKIRVTPPVLNHLFQIRIISTALLIRQEILVQQPSGNLSVKPYLIIS